MSFWPRWKEMFSDEIKSNVNYVKNWENTIYKAAQLRARGEICLFCFVFFQLEWESTMNSIKLSNVYLVREKTILALTIWQKLHEHRYHDQLIAPMHCHLLELSIWIFHGTLHVHLSCSWYVWGLINWLKCGIKSTQYMANFPLSVKYCGH